MLNLRCHTVLPDSMFCNCACHVEFVTEVALAGDVVLTTCGTPYMSKRTACPATW